MISRPILLGLLAAGCLTAAAGGAYVAIRQNDASGLAPNAYSAPVEAPKPSQAVPPATAPGTVAETEAVVTPPVAPDDSNRDNAAAAKKTPARTERPAPQTTTSARKDPAPSAPRPTRTVTAPAPSTAQAPVAQHDPSLPVERPAPARESTSTAHPTSAPTLPPVEPVVPDPPPAPPRPQFVEVVVPSSSVVGLQVETSISTETARVEDRVEGRVTRDVIADGRVAIPAGTRVIGDVTLVERGGKMKDKARLGVRFHTLVLADGNQVPFRTDSIYREGSSPGSESARKIGGAAMGGAILGAIIGGAKGAAIGGATGAGAGSAVVMAGDRNAATLPAGTIVTVRLSSPLSVDVEKDL